MSNRNHRRDRQARRRKAAHREWAVWGRPIRVFRPDGTLDPRRLALALTVGDFHLTKAGRRQFQRMIRPAPWKRPR